MAPLCLDRPPRPDHRAVHTRAWWMGLCAAAVCAHALPGYAAVEALDSAALGVVRGAPEDAPPKKLLGLTAALQGIHYLVGNEWHLEKYAPHLTNLRGAYVGVGSDQAYLFVGMVRPQVAWLIDYDQLVVHLHRIYFAFFAKAPTPKEFVHLWADEAAGLAVIGDALAGDAELAGFKKLYRRQRDKVAHRLHSVARAFRAAKVPCFLTDDEAYAFVRGSISAGRVRALRVDLLADKGMAGIADATRRLGLTVRVVYLSNADTYWAYSPQFRANITGLPFDAESRIVRTLAMWQFNRDYIYTLQHATNFVQWLARPWVRTYRDFVGWRPPKPDEQPFMVTNPDPVKADQRRAARTKGGGGARAGGTPR